MFKIKIFYDVQAFQNRAARRRFPTQVELNYSRLTVSQVHTIFSKPLESLDVSKISGNTTPEVVEALVSGILK